MSLEDLKIDHHFVGDEYAKVTEIPAGTKLTSHVHAFPHQSVLLCGRAVVRIGNSSNLYIGPKTLVVPAGMEHEVRAVTASLWACLWHNPEGIEDPAEFDKSVISAEPHA